MSTRGVRGMRRGSNAPVERGQAMRKKRVCLALQGGGSHGAFTWGVLDRLLEEASLEIQAVSGTSAGAMNGAILVDALKHGGRHHARERLERLWSRISAAGNGVFRPGRMLLPAFGPTSDWWPLAVWTEALSKDRDNSSDSPYKRIHLHEIKDEPNLAGLGYASKSNTDWPFLLELRDFGRHAAERWLRASFDEVGRKSTADMHAMLRCLESH
jgi:hypothetical protein